jgi:phosphomannomutase
MVGDAVRDKDAVASTLLICEIAAIAKANGSSVYQELLKLYVDFGFYKEFLVSITKKGIEGLEEIKQMMVDMRTNPLKEINGERIIMMEDYQTSVATNLLTGEKEMMSIPKSDVLIYYTDEGSKIAARPSGTEPKIKFYVSVNTTLESVDDFKEVNAQLDTKIKRILADLKID